MDSRSRAWWIDAGLVSLACMLLQRVDVEYSAHFFDHVVRNASLLHAEAGLLLAVALLGGDRRVLATAFLFNFLYWTWRVLLQGHEGALFIAGSAVMTLLQWRWIELCARWAGGPFSGQRLLVSGMGRYVLACLLLYPLGMALLSGAFNALMKGMSLSVANVAVQLFLAKHVGVGALTLPFLLLWSDDRLRQSPRYRWTVLVAWLCAGLAVAGLLEDMQAPALRSLVATVYDYRALIGAMLGVAMLLWRVEYSMPVLVMTHLLLLHGLTDQAQQAVVPVEMLRLLMHLVECNFLALILAVLFLLNRERMHRYHHVRAMCRHDASTGLDNAHALREAWRNAPAPPPVLGFLLLDQVERVLGSYGWRAQMLLLREAGRTMAPLAHAYHLGGGQFVLLPRAQGDAGGCTASLEEILKRLQGYVFRWQGAQLRMTPYLGLAHPERLGAQALDECLSNACDAALQARREGERSALPYVQAQPGESDPQARQNRLAAASEALACVHAGRVELHVQPIVRIDGGPPLPGFQGEVLCRLRRADGRLMMPGEFIADLEDSGHASELDIAVIETLFDWLRAHPQALPGIARLGINLSGKSLASATFRARFAELLRHPPLPHRALCFELTETAVIASQDSALRLFQDLRAHGCRLALDDFGSGVQNFERLKQVPVDSLKIDGQFVRNLQTQPSDLEIVRAAVAVANAYGLATVAEYVESASVAAQLAALGVQWGQGYHLGRPQPIAAALLALPEPVALPS